MSAAADQGSAAWRRGALLVGLGGLFGWLTALLMTPELPPLLAGWGPRQALADLALPEPALAALAALSFALAVGLPTWAALSLGRPGVAASGPAPSQAGRWVLVGVLVASALQLASPPRWSSDGFLFAFYGKIQAVHGENPYRLPSGAFARTCALPELPHRPATPGRPCRADAHCPPPSRCLVDPFVPYQAWLHVRAAYGPAALGLFRALYVEALPPEANVWLLRAFAALCWLLVVALVLSVAGARAAALVGWLPVGLVCAGNGGHLEALAGLALLATLAPALRPVRGPPALWIGLGAGLLAALKLPLAALAAPAVVWLLARHGWRQALVAAGLGAAVVGLGYALMWVAPHPFGGLADVASTTIRTPLDLIRRLARATGGTGDLSVARPALLALGGALGIAALLRLWRMGSGQVALLDATLAAWLLVTTLGSGIFHPWYALPGLVALGLRVGAARQPEAREARESGGLTGATLWIAVVAPIAVNGAWLGLGRASFALPWVVLPTLLVFVPALGLLARGALRRAA